MIMVTRVTIITATGAGASRASQRAEDAITAGRGGGPEGGDTARMERPPMTGSWSSGRAWEVSPTVRAVLCDRGCPRLGAEEAECGWAVLLQGGGGGLGPRGHGAVGQAGGLRGHWGGAQRQAGLQQLSDYNVESVESAYF